MYEETNVNAILLCDNHVDASILCYNSDVFRHCTTGNIQFKVMYGAMGACYMRYGVWDVNRLKSWTILRYTYTHQCWVIFCDIVKGVRKS